MRYNIFSLQSGTALKKCQNPLEDGGENYSDKMY